MSIQRRLICPQELLLWQLFALQLVILQVFSQAKKLVEGISDGSILHNRLFYLDRPTEQPYRRNNIPRPDS